MKCLSLVVSVFWLLSGLACSSGSNDGDGGIDDGAIDADGGDPGLDADGGDPGHEPDGGDPGQFADGLTLRIPQNLTLCNMNGAWTLLDWPYLKVRATLKAGQMNLPLPEAQDEFYMDMVERVEISPDGETIQPLDQGRFRFSRVDYGPEYPEYCVYNYTQNYQIDTEVYQLYTGFFFECEVGPIWELPGNMWPGFCPCHSLETYTPGKVTTTMANGDRIVFDYYYYEGCALWIGDGLCPMYMGDPSKGRFERGQDERVVNDFFSLALECAHHGPPRYFLMVFDQPLDGIHGIILDHDGPTPAEVHYLDADLSDISVSPVQDIVYE